MTQLTKTEEGPLSLCKIKEALAFRALQSGFLTPLRSFFIEMELEWGETKTAHAELRAGRPVIQFGREFFEKERVEVGEAVDILMHEIMHHLCQHLLHGEQFEEQGYNAQLQNVAMDAVINAYLAKVGCAGFMARFYKDEGLQAFLRPGSTEFCREPHGFFAWFRFDFDREKTDRWRNFYWRLYRLEVTLEEALAFFASEFASKAMKIPLLGSHGSPGRGRKKRDAEAKAPGNVFGRDVANSILRTLGFAKARNEAKSTFASVVKKITTSLKKPGASRHSARWSRRVPTKLGRRDMLNGERGKDLFARGDYRLREVWILPDISGSTDKYVPFVVDLIASLKRCEVEVKIAVWADSVAEVSLADFKRRSIPNVGGGTTGEAVARFIAERRLSEVIIITDNVAGNLVTKVRAKTHVCLVERSSRSGSFLDPAMVPFVRAYDLRPG